MAKGFVAYGHGYETGNLGRCTAFDGFTILAAPLGAFDEKSRDSRVWRAAGASYGVTYSSHAIKLAVRDTARARGLYILMQHGGGREVLELATGPDWEGMRDALLAMDERSLYAFLYSIWQTAANARREAQQETVNKWANAYQDGRIRKRRRSGAVSIYVESEFERDLRTGKAKPGAVVIDMASGEMSPA